MILRLTSKIFSPLLLLILFCLAFLSTMTFFLVSIKPVFAEENKQEPVSHRRLSDIERGNISTGCASIHTSLKNLQKNDSKTRVALGSSYQNLLSNFVTPLNIRLVKNNLPDPLLTKSQSELLSFRNDFTSQFITYSQKLESLIGLDCKTNPDDFYFELENVRSYRIKLETSIQKLNSAIVSHLKAVEQLKTTFTSSEKSTEPTTNKKHQSGEQGDK